MDAQDAVRGSSIEERVVNRHPLDLSNPKVLRELIFGGGRVQRNPRAILKCLIAHLYFERGWTAKAIANEIISRSLRSYDLYGETTTGSVEQYVHRMRRRYAEIYKRGECVEQTGKPLSALDEHQFERKFRAPARAEWRPTSGSVEEAFVYGDADEQENIEEAERLTQQALADLGRNGGVAMRPRQDTSPSVPMASIVGKPARECCAPDVFRDQRSDWLLESLGEIRRPKAPDKKKVKIIFKKARIICLPARKFVSLRARHEDRAKLIPFPLVTGSDFSHTSGASE